MNMIEKTVKVLENIRSLKNTEILSIKMSPRTCSMFRGPLGEGYDIEKGDKYIDKFSGIETFIDPYVKTHWVQVYYKTPVSSLNTVTITPGSI